MAITRFASASAALLFSTLALVSGCQKEVPGPDCEAQGGIFVDVDGEQVCEGKCDPTACLEGNTCVGNKCVLQCELDSDCLQALAGDEITQRCVAVTADSSSGIGDGDSVYICQDTPIHPMAGIQCPMGNECDALSACPDGSDCAAGGCDPAHCKPMHCVTEGTEDAESYCTTVDCATDDNCLPGHSCGVIRIENQLCGTNKGEGQPCIDPANNAAVGGTYQEGPVSVLQNACVKREPCSPCVENKDCTASRTDMGCVTIGEGTFCAETCLANDDCPDDFSCVGAAAPTAGFCVPRTSACKPPATNNFCYNCINDLDCGPAGPGNTMGCLELPSLASPLNKACVDLGFTIPCTSDAQCPTSPSGRSGECLDEDEGLSPGQPEYHKCYAPLVASLGGYSCWTAN